MNMKKTFAIILALAVACSLSVAAFADGPQGGNFQQMPGNFQQGQGGPNMGSQPPQMNGQAPSGEAPEMNGQPPEMNGQAPFGASAFIDFDALAEEGVISEETLEKIKAYMEENKPDDLPEMNGQAPSGAQAPSDEAPEMNGQPPEMNGQAPGMNGQRPEMNGQAPNGEKPEDLPEMNGEAPAFDGENPENVNGLLGDLLSAGVITQSEYDAIVAALEE